MEINESKYILKGERIEGKNKIMTREGGENFFFNITEINKSKSTLKKWLNQNYEYKSLFTFHSEFRLQV